MVSKAPPGWHINDENKVMACSAGVKSCHFDKHFKTKQRAVLFARSLTVQASLNGALDSLSSGKVSTPALAGIPFTQKRPPQIYAFVVDALADMLNATKVGDTTRGVDVRLNEWRRKGGIYENLTELFNIDAAFQDKNGEAVYVRDYNFHLWLKRNGFQALVDVLDEYPKLKGLPEGISQEFYFNKEDRSVAITKEMIERSLAHQREMFENPASPYAYYREVRGQSVTAHYAPVNEYEMRPFQAEIVAKAKAYFDTTDEPDPQFLLSAPTRSGKSFMAANTVSQLFAESPKKNNCAVVVSGFAEIEDEWKATFESHKKFAREVGKADENKCGTSPCSCANRIKYFNIGDLRMNRQSVEHAYNQGYDNVVVFLTLQDLAGSTHEDNDVKEAHSFLREEGSVDFVIGDEAHFAMFSEGRYQDSINGGQAEEADNGLSAEDDAAAAEILGTMKPTIGKLFVTATPYNNVPWGTKYNQSLNAAIIREADIKKQKDDWDAANVELGDDAAPEWYNPSYGIPEKKMFGVDLGMAPNELFRMQGEKFAHEAEVTSFIANIFSSRDSESSPVPNFFGSKEFADAGLGNHIYATLPSRKACDAFEKALKLYMASRSNSQYEVLNISSARPRHATSKKKAAEIKDDITRFAQEGKRTITVTCNRMGTGVTQEYWDTVLILRTMSSAQQFQQTAGRAGTPRVSSRDNLSEKVRLNKKLCRSCESKDVRAPGKFLCATCYKKAGDEGEALRADSTMKHVEKPTVAIISLDPGQLVKIRQEAIISSISGDAAGISQQLLDDYVKADLDASQLYILDSEKKMVRVNQSNIMDHFLAHLKGQGVKEMVGDIPIFTENLSDDLTQKIMNNYGYVDTKRGLFETKIAEGFEAKHTLNICIIDGCDSPVRGMPEGAPPARLCYEHWQETQTEDQGEGQGDVEELSTPEERTPEEEAEALEELQGRVKNLYISVLLYAVLSRKHLSGIDSILESAEEYEGSRRLARHLGLDLEIMKEVRYSGVAGLELDRRVELLNKLTRDTSLNESWERLALALNSFKRFSDSEVPTSDKVSEELVGHLQLEEEDYKRVAESGTGFIDIGSKSAINLVNIVEKAKTYDVDLSQKMWAVPTSGKTFELNRRVFKDYGWDTDHIIFHDNLDNLETVEMMALFAEMKECRAATPEECRYHNQTNAYSKMALALDGIKAKLDDDEAYDKFRQLAQDSWKFDYSISNPIYDRASSFADQKKSMPVYPLYIEHGSEMSDVSVMIHPLKAFRGIPAKPSPSTTRIMGREGFSVEYVADFSQVFENVNTKGMVAITRFDKESKNKVNWHQVGLPEGAAEIVNKVLTVEKDNPSISEKMFSMFHYSDSVVTDNNLKKREGIHSNHPDLYPDLMKPSADGLTNPVKVYCRSKNKRVERYTEFSNLDEKSQTLSKDYKVLIAGGIGKGKFGEKISDVIVTNKKSIATRSFTNIGPFTTKYEADAFSKYLQTRFARMLLSTKKITQNTPISAFGNIPAQDFTRNSSIDWTQSLDGIDEQLFNKYRFTEDDKAWVRTNVEGM